MKRTIIIFLASLMALVASAQNGGVITFDEGSFLRQNQKRDSILIGDQLQYGATVKDLVDGANLMLPDLSKGLMEGVEVVSPWEVDTVKVSKEKKGSPKLTDVEVKMVITSFDAGRYELPRVSVVRVMPDGQMDTLVFNSQVLDVKEMPIDTTTFVPHDIRGQMKYPVTFKEVLPYILIGLLAALLVALVVWLILKHRKNKAEEEAKDPAHIIALRKLDKLRGNKYWAPDKQKFFYSGVTDALREYMAARYGIGAMEMTTAEIFAELKKTDVPKDLYDEMKGLFETSDFVKFAKMTVSDEENAKVVPQAVNFVTATYQSEIDEEAEAADKEEKK